MGKNPWKYANCSCVFSHVFLWWRIHKRMLFMAQVKISPEKHLFILTNCIGEFLWVYLNPSISPYKYLLVASPASPICTMKPRYQYIVGNLYSQGRFAEKQNFNFCFVPPERSQSVVSRWNCDNQGCCDLTNLASFCRYKAKIEIVFLQTFLVSRGFQKCMGTWVSLCISG